MRNRGIRGVAVCARGRDGRTEAAGVPGYDSAGVAVLADGGLAAAKKAGKLVNLEKELVDRPLPTGPTGIGHTRWATHGGPTDANAHPHLDNAGRVAVVHNGIIENFAALRAELTERGHDLASETDTEVVAHLLAEEFSSCGDLAEAMRLVCRRLDGAFTLVAVHADEPDVVVGARRNSPLVVGVGEGRRSSRPMWRPSSRTPAPPSSSARTRSSSCAATG